MAYIGKPPNTAIVNQATSQSFSGNGSTTFTLNRSVNRGEDLEVFVENVQQEPGSGKSYTASGTTLTFDEAPPSGTNNIYVIYRGEATINPRLEHDANAALAATTGTFSDAVSGASGTFSSSSSGEFNALTISQANNTSGNESRIRFKRTTDAGSDREVAAIVADRVGGNDTALVFETNTDGSDGATERVRINQDGNVGIGTSGPTHPLHVIGDVQAENSSGHRALIVKGSSTTNYEGGSLLLANAGMDTNYGGTYLYHHKAGGSGTQNAAFNISQRTAGGAYVSNIWNVDYQNSAHSFYVPNGGISGGVALGITSAGHVTKSVQPSFVARLTGSTTSAGAKWTTNGTPQHNVGNHWSTSTHRFTAPVAGRYLLLCSAYTNFTTSYGYMAFYINGSNQGAYSRHFNNNGHQQHIGLSMNVIWNLNANDYVEWGRPGAGGGYFDIVNVGAYLLG